MCGWLPLQHQLEESLREHPSNAGKADEEDPFHEWGVQTFRGESLSPKDEAAWIAKQVVEYYDDMLDNEKLAGKDADPPFLNTCVFLGHGMEDDKVPIDLGREATSCLRRCTKEVEWKPYEELVHWYSEAMLEDMVIWLSRFHVSTLEEKAAAGNS